MEKGRGRGEGRKKVCCGDSLVDTCSVVGGEAARLERKAPKGGRGRNRRKKEKRK